jgi:hypothetical protein
MTSCHGLWVDLSSVIGLHTGSQTTHKMSTQLDRMEEQLQKLLKVAVENRILEKWILAGVIVCIALLLAAVLMLCMKPRPAAEKKTTTTTYVESPVYTSAPVVSYSPAPVQMMPAYAAPAMTTYIGMPTTTYIA